MQAIEHDGKERMMTRYDPDDLKKLLEDPRVKEVRVFKLKKGMTINIEGSAYKVIAVRANGKVTLRPR